MAKQTLKKTTLSALISLIAIGSTNSALAEQINGNDLNAAVDSPLASLFSANRGTNGGGDQSQQFGDILFGTAEDDVMYGFDGADMLVGNDGDDILIGGPEGGFSINRDRILGGNGTDLIVWNTGDGNDFIDGGPDNDFILMNTYGSLLGNQSCRIIEKSPAYFDDLEALNLDHLIIFNVARSQLDEGADDSPVPYAALHVRNVEYLICGDVYSEDSNALYFYDISQVPYEQVDVSQIPADIQSYIDGLSDPED